MLALMEETALVNSRHYLLIAVTRQSHLALATEVVAVMMVVDRIRQPLLMAEAVEAVRQLLPHLTAPRLLHHPDVSVSAIGIGMVQIGSTMGRIVILLVPVSLQSLMVQWTARFVLRNVSLRTTRQQRPRCLLRQLQVARRRRQVEVVQRLPLRSHHLIVYVLVRLYVRCLWAVEYAAMILIRKISGVGTRHNLVALPLLIVWECQLLALVLCRSWALAVRIVSEVVLPQHKIVVVK